MTTTDDRRRRRHRFGPTNQPMHRYPKWHLRFFLCYFFPRSRMAFLAQCLYQCSIPSASAVCCISSFALTRIYLYGKNRSRRRQRRDGTCVELLELRNVELLWIFSPIVKITSWLNAGKGAIAIHRIPNTTRARDCGCYRALEASVCRRLFPRPLSREQDKCRAGRRWKLMITQIVEHCALHGDKLIGMRLYVTACVCELRLIIEDLNSWENRNISGCFLSWRGEGFKMNWFRVRFMWDNCPLLIEMKVGMNVWTVMRFCEEIYIVDRF